MMDRSCLRFHCREACRCGVRLAATGEAIAAGDVRVVGASSATTIREAGGASVDELIAG